MRYTESQMNSELMDQPELTGEPRKIFICSTPRSGSYMLCRFMINAGLGLPHEYFNPIVMRQIAGRLDLGDSINRLQWRPVSPWDRLPFGKARRAAEADFLARYIGALVPRRCRRGIFAAKVHYDQYLKVLHNAVGWKLLDGGLFIYLYREDLLKQAVSAHFAHLTGRWSIDDAVTTVPAARPDFFDVAGIDRTLEGLAREDQGWRVFLARNGVSPIAISYEQLCKDPSGFVVAIAQRLGIDPRTLHRGYSEEASQSDRDPALPDKHEVARRYLASMRKIEGAMLARSRPAVRAMEAAMR